MARKYTKRNSAYWEAKGVTPKKNKNLHEEVKSLDHAKSQDLQGDESHLREFVVDGKYRDGEDEIKKIKDLEELIGVASSNPFGTADERIFAESLEEKTKTDLQNLCMRVGIPPRTSIEETKSALKREFKHFSSKHGTAMPGEIKQAIPPNSEHAKIIKDLTEN